MPPENDELTLQVESYSEAGKENIEKSQENYWSLL